MKNEKGFFRRHALGLLIGGYVLAGLASLATNNLSTFALISVIVTAGAASMGVMYKVSESINNQINEEQKEELLDAIDNEFEKNKKDILNKEYTAEKPVYTINNVTVEYPIAEKTNEIVNDEVIENQKVKSLTNNKKHY